MLAINSLRRLSHLDTLSMDYPSRERPELSPRPSSAAADRLRRRKDLLSHHGLRGPFRAARRRRYTLVVGASSLVDGFGRALQLQASVSLAALSLVRARRRVGELCCWATSCSICRHRAGSSPTGPRPGNYDGLGCNHRVAYGVIDASPPGRKNLRKRMGVALLDCRSVALCHVFPVYHVPPGFYVLGSVVPVLQVVGVLPNI